MSRRKKHNNQQPPAETPQESTHHEVAKGEPKRKVAKYRQCPLCYSGLGGVGNVYSTQHNKRYYKCDECGHTWTAKVIYEKFEVEHRRVELETRDE